MPAHERQQIREYVRSILLGKTDAGPRVFKNRVIPLRVTDLPAISVYNGDEDVDESSANTAPREFTRLLQLKIAGWVEAGDGFDDRMDDLALQIENVMDPDPFFGGIPNGLVADCILSKTEPGMKPEGDKLMGFLVMTYAVTYRTDERGLKGAGLDDFLNVDAKYPPNNVPLDVNTPEDNFHTRTTP